jgi:hypothetical protein
MQEKDCKIYIRFVKGENKAENLEVGLCEEQNTFTNVLNKGP